MKRNDKKKGIVKNIRQTAALLLFCLVMSIGMVCLADEQGTVTVASAKIRASADAGSEQLGSVAQGGTVDIIGKTTGSDGKTWYQVYVDASTKGYIRGDLVKLKDGAELKTVQPSGASAQGDTTPTPATSTEARRATVTTNNVRIRKGASTNHDVVATANRGMVVTVTGETNGSDGKTWYQVSFTYNDKDITGFIRSDLVTFENVPADTAVSEITGEGSTEGEEQAPETQPQEEQPQETPAQTNENEVTPMEAEEMPYVMPGFTAFKLAHEGQEYEAFRNGTFYIIYGQKQDGEVGWFLFDSDKKVYTRYPYTAAGVTEPSGKTVGMLPVIVLVIIVVILVAVVGLLLLKLRENVTYGRSYGRNNDDRDDDDIEDLEDLEDDDMPLSRPQGRRPQPQGGQQPSRRPQPQGGQQPGGRPQPARPANGQGNPQGRRPQPQGGGQQPGRRPQPQGGNVQPGGRPQSRPSNGQGNPQGRRPQPQGGNAQPGGRRPQPQNDKAASQKGYKAKGLLEEDDDIDLMDL